MAIYDLYNTGGLPHKTDGWAGDLSHFFGANDQNSIIGNWFKNNYAQNNKYINSMSDKEVAALLESFWKQDSSWLWSNMYSLDYDEINKYLSQLENYDKILGEMPTAPDYEAIQKEAYNAINSENQELLGMLDQDLARQQNLYQGELNDINSMYGDLRRQTLENNYRNNAQLMGTVGSEMSKARRNALESGASAGMRLAENVNTLLSVQNKQSQQSLETSNQLAQQLLNQRQAAMGVRSAWGQAQSANTQSKIGIKQGTTERAENFANNRFDTENKVYDNKMTQWEDKYNTVTEGNPFAESYRNYYRKNQYGY